MTTYKKALGRAIQERRKRLELTQKDLATACGLDQKGTVSRWERGLAMPLDLETVAEALNTTVAELVTGVDWSTVTSAPPGVPPMATMTPGAKGSGDPAFMRILALLEVVTKHQEQLLRNHEEFLTRIARMQRLLGEGITDTDVVTLIRRGMGLDEMPPAPAGLEPASAMRPRGRGRRRQPRPDERSGTR